MVYSDEQIENIRVEIREFLGLKQVLGFEQLGGDDIFFRGLSHDGREIKLRFKPQTGTVFHYINNRPQQIKGLIITSVHDQK